MFQADSLTRRRVLRSLLSSSLMFFHISHDTLHQLSSLQFCVTDQDFLPLAYVTSTFITPLQRSPFSPG